MGRRKPSARAAWKTFTVSVCETRGDARVYAAVRLSHVTGVDGTPYIPRVVWEGWVGNREPGQHLSPEEAAQYALDALENAYPTLF